MGDVGDQVLDESDGKIIMFLVAGKVVKRQDGDTNRLSRFGTRDWRTAFVTSLIDIVRANRTLFDPATPPDTEAYLRRARHRGEAFTIEVDTADLPLILELTKDDPVWDTIGAKCLCCGSCSTVCPTCSCFNVADEVGEGGVARRRRTWDSCLFRDYATVAGGHSFRSDRSERIRTRYYHKQEAFVREFGMPSCVGCGRCIDNCPTGINVVEVFATVRGDL